MLNQKYFLIRHLILSDNLGNKTDEVKNLSKLTVCYTDSFNLRTSKEQVIEAFYITSFQGEEEATEFITSTINISKYGNKYIMRIL